MQNTIFLYGQPGYGKTTFSATFPKPLLHLCFDPESKARPMHYGMVTEYDDMGFGVPGLTSESGVQTELWGKVSDKRDFPIRFRNRLGKIEEHWKTVVIDSCSALGYLWRQWNEEFARNKNGEKLQDPRKHFGYASEQFNWVFNIGLLRIPSQHIIVIAHIVPVKDEKSGELGEAVARVGRELLHVPYLPGKLPVTSGGSFSEVWRMYVERKKGSRIYKVQTQPDGYYLAHTLSNAPDGAEADFNLFGGLV